jgi:alginate O-acetyltransferase complex protein AlgI
MSVAGLWHGANFNFILWGFLNGLLLFIEKKINFFLRIHLSIKILINCFVIFNLWLVFRLQDFNLLYEYLMIFYSNLHYFFLKENLIILAITIIAVLSQKYDNYYYIKNFATQVNVRYIFPIIFLIIALGLSFSSGTSDKFIYFDF